MVKRKVPVEKKFAVFGSIGAGSFRTSSLEQARAKAKMYSRQKRYGYKGFIVNLKNQKVTYRSYDRGELQ